MKFGVRILQVADQDVDELFGAIVAGSAEHAVRFLDRVNETYKDIADHPTRWAFYEFPHVGLTGIRKRSVIDFPKILVFFRVDADMIEIVRVLHGARDIAAIFGAMVEGS